MELKNLCGHHILRGIETGCTEIHGESANYVQFTLDRTTYRLVEDPDDGYRSFCSEPEIVEELCNVSLPDIHVLCHHIDCLQSGEGDDDILVMIDEKSWRPILKVGTADVSDYYPCCIMKYMPQNMAVNQRVEADAASEVETVTIEELQAAFDDAAECCRHLCCSICDYDRSGFCATDRWSLSAREFIDIHRKRKEAGQC